MQRVSNQAYAMTFKTTCDAYTGEVATLGAGPVIERPHPIHSLAKSLVWEALQATVMLFPLGNRWGVHWFSPQNGCLKCKWWQVYFQTVQGVVPFF